MVKAFSQGGNINPGGWKFTSLDGEIRLRGNYFERHTLIKELKNYEKSSYFSGGLSLETKSYIFHPNFLQLDLGGEFSPESNSEDYMNAPDQSDVRTLKALYIRTTLLNSKPFTLLSWADWNDSYSNRENLANIRSNTFQFGSTMMLKSKFLPLNASFNSTKWDQYEIETGRTFKSDQNNFDVFTEKSFTDRDNSQLSYSRNNYFRRDANENEIDNITDRIKFNNKIYLDRNNNFALRSRIYHMNRKGSQTFQITNFSEHLDLKLPYNFILTGTYNFDTNQQEMQETVKNRISASLNQQLFSSLNTSLNYSYNGIKNTLYENNNNLAGLGLNYNKIIPGGRLSLNYSGSYMKNEMDAEPVDLPVYNEAHLLSDGEIITLDRPYIDVNTIEVKNNTGSIIYQIDFDYLLIEQGDYIEIQRIPGGQIPNNSTVYVDYVAVQIGSYKYDAISNNVNAYIILFNRLLELYYRGQFVDFKNVQKSDLLVLNYIKRNTYGAKIRYWDAELGLEYEYHNSTITPYKLMRYYLNLQKRINKFILSLNGNIRNYNMLDENVNRKYSDLSGKAAYEIRPRTMLHLMLGYRYQEGPGIDMDLLTASTEFKTVYRLIDLTAGVSAYLRDYLGDTTNYYRVYLEIARRF